MTPEEVRALSDAELDALHLSSEPDEQSSCWIDGPASAHAYASTIQRAVAEAARTFFEVEPLYETDDSGGAVGYWTAGHVDREAFAQFLHDEWLEGARVEFVEHRYMRKVPTNVGYPGWWTAAWASKPGRGATPVTYFDLDGQQIEDAAALRAARATQHQEEELA